MTEQEALDIMCDLWTDIEHHNTDYETLWSEEREEAYNMAMSALEEIQQYREIGTVEEIKEMRAELARWHTDRLNDRIHNEFACMSTLVCHNCDHKDDYIEELEAEIEEYRAIGTVEECREAREKQKACAPKRKMMLSPVGGWIADCKCGAVVRSYEKYCSNCGQAVLWEGGDE